MSAELLSFLLFSLKITVVRYITELVQNTQSMKETWRLMRISAERPNYFQARDVPTWWNTRSTSYLSSHILSCVRSKIISLITSIKLIFNWNWFVWQRFTFDILSCCCALDKLRPITHSLVWFSCRLLLILFLFNMLVYTGLDFVVCLPTKLYFDAGCVSTFCQKYGVATKFRTNEKWIWTSPDVVNLCFTENWGLQVGTTFLWWRIYRR